MKEAEGSPFSKGAEVAPLRASRITHPLGHQLILMAGSHLAATCPSVPPLVGVLSHEG